MTQRYSLSVVHRPEMDDRKKGWWVEAWDTKLGREATRLVRGFATQELASAYADGIEEGTLDHID